MLGTSKPVSASAAGCGANSDDVDMRRCGESVITVCW